jgi:drug/metabolite transporter (DMT)-like permease
MFLAPVYWLRPRAARVQTSLRAHLPLLLILSACSAGNQIIFLLGLNRTSVAHSAIIIGMGPIFVLLISAAARIERITTRKVIGMLVALAGVAVLVRPTYSDTMPGHPLAPSTLAGDALVALASLAFSVFAVFGKKATELYSPIVMNAFAYGVVALALLPFAGWQAREFAFAHVSSTGWASLAYMAVFPSAICYIIYYYALSHIAPSRVSAFTYLQPLIATLLAVVFLDERVTAPLVAGGTVIFGGVYLAERG